MSDPAITFRAPPLTETALSLQFEPIPRLTNAHLGAFWAESLASDYPVLEEDAPPLEPQFERFGEEIRVALRIPRVRIRQFDALSTRFRAVTRARDRMVQAQNGRLVLNWLRVEGQPYPRYCATLPELERALRLFTEFLAGAGLGRIRINQWEVTYVNHVAQGSLWNSPSDLNSLVPRLLGPAGADSPGELESVQGSWRYVLPGSKGRLHVDLSHGWKAAPSGPQILVLQLTARGPVNTEETTAVTDGLNLGHAAIVQEFARVTSEKAQSAWERLK